MYNAMIRYKFKEGMTNDGVTIWKNVVYQTIINHPGFMRVQAYSRPVVNEFIAIGSWQDKKYAEEYMRTGVFKLLMENIKEYLAEDPVSGEYFLEAFEEA